MNLLTNKFSKFKSHNLCSGLVATFDYCDNLIYSSVQKNIKSKVGVRTVRNPKFERLNRMIITNIKRFLVKK